MRVGQRIPGRSAENLGNLGLPAVMPALPPGSSQEWDISSHLSHYYTTANLYLELAFRDPADISWRRDFSGTLSKVGLKKPKFLPADPVEMTSQLGDLSPRNPFYAALKFYRYATSEDLEERRKILGFCTPESVWDDLSKVYEILKNLGMATYLEYPTDGVAYIKFVESASRNAVVQAGHLGPVVPALIMTLQYRPREGEWKVHCIGPPCPPEELPAIFDD